MADVKERKFDWSLSMEDFDKVNYAVMEQMIQEAKDKGLLTPDKEAELNDLLKQYREA